MEEKKTSTCVCVCVYVHGALMSVLKVCVFTTYQWSMVTVDDDSMSLPPIAKRRRVPVKIEEAVIPGKGVVWQCCWSTDQDGEPKWTDYPEEFCMKLEKLLADGKGTGLTCVVSIKYVNNINVNI